MARDFSELERRLPKPSGDSIHTVRLALEAFADRRDLDLRFRDYALRFAAEHDEWHNLRYFRNDRIVAAAVVKAARDRREFLNSAIDTLPWILGDEAVPHLLRLLDEIPIGDEYERSALADTIQALERSAHLRITIDGARKPLPTNSDDPDYAAEEYDAFRPEVDATTLSQLVTHWQAWGRMTRSQTD